MDIYFISKTNKTLYSAKARAEDYQNFNVHIGKWGGNFDCIRRGNPDGFSYIVVPVRTVRS